MMLLSTQRGEFGTTLMRTCSSGILATDGSLIPYLGLEHGMAHLNRNRSSNSELGCVLRERQKLGSLIQAREVSVSSSWMLFMSCSVFLFLKPKVRRCTWAFLMTSGNLWEVSYSSLEVFTKEKELAHKQLEWSNRCTASFILTYLEIIYSNLPIP